LGTVLYIVYDLNLWGEWYNKGWGVNPFPLQAKPFRPTLKYIRRIEDTAIATREHLYIIELCSTLVY